MALDEAALAAALTVIFDVTTTPSTDDQNFATLVLAAIVTYLEDVEGPEYAGGSVGSAGTDGVESGKCVPVTALDMATFGVALHEACAAHAAGEPRDFDTTCIPAWKTDLATFINSTDDSSYLGVGATVASVGPLLNAAFDTGMPDGSGSAAVATAVAAAVHLATTSAVHTVTTFGITEGGFAGPVTGENGGSGNLE